MGITPLSPHSLENIQYFKFKNYDDSVIRQFFLSPVVFKCLDFVNRIIEPNLITFTSFIIILISFIITAIDGHGDFNQKLSSCTCYIQAIAYLLSFLFDTINNAQMRRMDISYNPCEIILIRELAVFKLIIISYNYHHLLSLGNSNIFSIMIYISLYLGYYNSIYEESLFQEISLWYYKGSSDSILLLAIMSLITGIADDYLWSYKWSMLLSQWITLSIFIISITGIVYSFFNIIRQRKLSGLIYISINSVLVLNIYFVPLILIYYENNFVSEYFWLIILALSLLFAIVTIELQLRVYLNEIKEITLHWIIANLLFICSIFIHNEKILVLLFITIALILGTQIVLTTVTRWIEISRFFQLNYLFFDSKRKKYIMQ